MDTTNTTKAKPATTRVNDALRKLGRPERLVHGAALFLAKHGRARWLRHKLVLLQPVQCGAAA